MGKKLLIFIFSVIITWNFATAANKEERIDPIAHASYYVLTGKGDSVVFYTYNGDQLFESKEKQYIDNARKYLDPHAPKPQPIEYEIISRAILDMVTDSDRIKFYDKHDNVIDKNKYDIQWGEIRKDGRNYKFPTSNFEKLTNFPLDLTIAKDRTSLKLMLYNKTSRIRETIAFFMWGSIFASAILFMNLVSPIIEVSRFGYQKVKEKFSRIKKRIKKRIKNNFSSKKSILSQ